MMKKVICIILTLMLFLLCSCGEETVDSSAVSAEVDSAVEKANSANQLSGGYMLEISFGSGSVLYYAKGDIAWDRSEKNVYAKFDQTYLGVSSILENYFSDGKMISIEGSSSVESERDPDELFGKFPYFQVMGSQGEVTKGSNVSGDTYTFTLSDSKSLAESVVGGDIYSLVTVLSKPQKDKTEYGEAKCVYTVKDGELVSCRYEFDIKLFDTPAYIPGYSQPESEYTITVHVTAKVSYDSFDGEVEIPEYSKEFDKSE